MQALPGLATVCTIANYIEKSGQFYHSAWRVLQQARWNVIGWHWLGKLRTTIPDLDQKLEMLVSMVSDLGGCVEFGISTWLDSSHGNTTTPPTAIAGALCHVMLCQIQLCKGAQCCTNQGTCTWPFLAHSITWCNMPAKAMCTCLCLCNMLCTIAQLYPVHSIAQCNTPQKLLAEHSVGQHCMSLHVSDVWSSVCCTIQCINLST